MRKIEIIGSMDNSDGSHEMCNRVYGKDGLSPTIPTASGGGHIPKVMDTVKIKQANKQGYIECEIGGAVDMSYPSSTTRRGRVTERGTICPTLTTENNPNVIEPWIWKVGDEYYRIRVRKLTPKECFRLMSFSDEDFSKAQAVNSNTQLYKQAGNSIVKDVLKAIFKEMI